jgi:ketosteroid isomerase-like protein
MGVVKGGSMRSGVLLGVMAVLVVFACAPAEAPKPAVDMEAERASLLAADKAWYEAYSSGDNPVDALLGHMTDDARFQFAENPPAHGKEAIRPVITQLEEMPGFAVKWVASAADVSSSGDLGYTVGTYEMGMDGPDGKKMSIQGHYVTIWKKQPDGSWKVVVDTGGPSGPPTPVGE